MSENDLEKLGLHALEMLCGENEWTFETSEAIARVAVDLGLAKFDSDGWLREIPKGGRR